MKAKTVPASSGERLDLLVYWTGIKVGRVSIVDHGLVTLRDKPCHKLEAYARTIGPIEKIYKTKRRYFGYLTLNEDSWIFEEWKKKKRKWRMEEWLGFFPAEKVVRRYKKGKVRNVVKTPYEVYGPVGAIQYLRSRDLQPGDRYRVNVIEGKERYVATAEVAEGGILDTIIGPVSTRVVTPRIFWKGKPLGKRMVKIWFTDDQRKIPVKLYGDIEFGNFTAELNGYQAPDSESGSTSPG